MTDARGSWITPAACRLGMHARSLGAASLCRIDNDWAVPSRQSHIPLPAKIICHSWDPPIASCTLPDTTGVSQCCPRSLLRLARLRRAAIAVAAGHAARPAPATAIGSFGSTSRTSLNIWAGHALLLTLPLPLRARVCVTRVCCCRPRPRHTDRGSAERRKSGKGQRLRGERSRQLGCSGAHRPVAKSRQRPNSGALPPARPRSGSRPLLAELSSRGGPHLSDHGGLQRGPLLCGDCFILPTLVRARL